MSKSVQMIATIDGEEKNVGRCHPGQARIMQKNGLAEWKNGKLYLSAGQQKVPSGWNDSSDWGWDVLTKPLEVPEERKKAIKEFFEEILGEEVSKFSSVHTGNRDISTLRGRPKKEKTSELPTVSDEDIIALLAASAKPLEHTYKDVPSHTTSSEEEEEIPGGWGTGDPSPEMSAKDLALALWSNDIWTNFEGEPVLSSTSIPELKMADLTRKENYKRHPVVSQAFASSTKPPVYRRKVIVVEQYEGEEE